MRLSILEEMSADAKVSSISFVNSFAIDLATHILARKAVLVDEENHLQRHVNCHCRFQSIAFREKESFE